jgi:uncharacterized lipoprotein YddW (UPF0748 family)
MTGANIGVVAFWVLALLSFTASGATAAAELKVALVTDPGGRQDAESARSALERMRGILPRAGLQYTVLSEGQVLDGALGDFNVAIVPYAPNLSRGAKAMLRSFCSDGGKVMCFYSTYGLDAALGLQGVSYVSSADRTLFCHVKCRTDAIRGLPPGFNQVSWNINAPSVRPGTRVLADWLDVNGKSSGYIAATVSDGGFYFSHVIVAEGDAEEANAGAMLRAAAEYLVQRVQPRPAVAIIYGTESERGATSDSALVGRMAGEMERILSWAGLPYAVLTDEAVARGALQGRRAAILPLNFKVPDPEVRALQQFVAAGGKVIGFFSVDSRLLPLMGVAETAFRAGGPATPFNVVRFNAAAPATFPKAFGQRSSNIMTARAAPDGKVVGNWFDADGTDTGCPAVILSPSGMYFSYILSAGDLQSTSQFMLAGIAHLAGQDMYAPAAQHAGESLWDFRRYKDREGLAAACKVDPRAAEAVAAAVRLEEQARKHLAAGKAYDAWAAFREAREASELAFIRSLPSRGGREFRGAWLHSPDAPGGDWDTLFAGMRKSHLNALVVNVSTGGYAHYQSDLLPLSRQAKERGQQVEKMLAAAKRQGIEVHLWRVNYNLFGPEKEVLDKMVGEKRVCLDPKGNIVGGPASATLCPSNPANQQLEIEATIELTRKFHPDGIHFDYIRYPGGEACYCEGCRERFEKATGAKVTKWPDDVLAGGPLRQKYLDFRRDQITLVVREASRRSRELDPAVKVSAAVFQEWDAWARDDVGQDWPLWIQKGYLDFVCPMDYVTDADVLAAAVAKQVKWVSGRAPLEVGLGAWQQSAAWQVADMVATARANGADGLVFFDYRGPVASDFIPALLEGPFREDARTPWAK